MMKKCSFEKLTVRQKNMGVFMLVDKTTQLFPLDGRSGLISEIGGFPFHFHLLPKNRHLGPFH